MHYVGRETYQDVCWDHHSKCPPAGWGVLKNFLTGTFYLCCYRCLVFNVTLSSKLEAWELEEPPLTSVPRPWQWNELKYILPARSRQSRPGLARCLKLQWQICIDRESPISSNHNRSDHMNMEIQKISAAWLSLQLYSVIYCSILTRLAILLSAVPALTVQLYGAPRYLLVLRCVVTTTAYFSPSIKMARNIIYQNVNDENIKKYLKDKILRVTWAKAGMTTCEKLYVLDHRYRAFWII